MQMCEVSDQVPDHTCLHYCYYICDNYLYKFDSKIFDFVDVKVSYVGKVVPTNIPKPVRSSEKTI